MEYSRAFQSHLRSSEAHDHFPIHVEANEHALQEERELLPFLTSQKHLNPTPKGHQYGLYTRQVKINISQ